MKLQQIILTVIIILLSSSIGNAQINCSTIKGKVVNWPTDTVYLQTMPFYSPYSSELVFQILDEESTFSFELEIKDIPWIVQLYSNKTNAELNKEHLLFLNYTDDYYYGHCVKFYTYSANTFLLEPGKVLDVELESNRTLEKLSPEMAEKYRKAGAKILDDNMIEQIHETNIQFHGENTFQDIYFQKTFDLTDKVDNRLELYQNKPIEKAIESYTKIRQKLLDNLEVEKGNLSVIIYEYIKAEIEFGARVEFLKYLMFSYQEKENKALDLFFSNEIPQDILDIIEFNKDEISAVIMANEEYNKYLEIYLNFKINIQNGKFSAYNEFSIQKCKTAIRELPKESAYYYLTGQFLHTFRTEDFVEDLVIETIKAFPEGELNDKLMEKYDL
jgi:hypothetical protein